MHRFLGINSVLAVLFPFFADAMSMTSSPNQKLLSLVPPGAQVVAGISAPSRRDQPSNFLLITHDNNLDLTDFYTLSGADSSRSIHQIILVAMVGMSGLDEHSILVSGHFDQPLIYRSAVNGGADITRYRGIPVLVVQPFARERANFNSVRWLAVLDADVLLFGTVSSVQQQLDRYLAGGAADASLLRRLTHLRHDNQTWCVLSAPAENAEVQAAFAVLDPKLATLIQDADAFQFGIRYSRQVEFEYEVTAASITSARSISGAFAQSLAGGIHGLSMFSPPELNGDNTARGVIKLSIRRYNAWLAELTARGLSRGVSP